VQTDELRVKAQRDIVWMALAMRGRTRVWLAGEVSAHRNMPLIRRLIDSRASPEHYRHTHQNHAIIGDALRGQAQRSARLYSTR
jgi:hypothetical protein